MVIFHHMTWLPVDLPNISAIIDCFETWLVPIERSFQELSVAVETVRIVKELMEICKGALRGILEHARH